MSECNTKLNQCQRAVIVSKSTNSFYDFLRMSYKVYDCKNKIKRSFIFIIMKSSLKNQNWQALYRFLTTYSENVNTLINFCACALNSFLYCLGLLQSLILSGKIYYRTYIFLFLLHFYYYYNALVLQNFLSTWHFSVDSFAYLTLLIRYIG